MQVLLPWNIRKADIFRIKVYIIKNFIQFRAITYIVVAIKVISYFTFYDKY